MFIPLREYICWETSMANCPQWHIFCVSTWHVRRRLALGKVLTCWLGFMTICLSDFNSSRVIVENSGLILIQHNYDLSEGDHKKLYQITWHLQCSCKGIFLWVAYWIKMWAEYTEQQPLKCCTISSSGHTTWEVTCTSCNETQPVDLQVRGSVAPQI